MSDMNFHQTWLKLTIDDVADVIAGGTPKAGDPENFAEPGTGISWLTPADLSGYKNKYISHGARDLSEIGYNSSSAKKCRLVVCYLVVERQLVMLLLQVMKYQPIRVLKTLSFHMVLIQVLHITF